MMNDLAAAVLPVIELFESLNIPYCIGGSVASSAFGIPRSTLNADIVADLAFSHVDTIVERLLSSYYVDAGAMREAIERRTSFNLIHLETMMKVDVFIPRDRSFDRSVLSRRVANAGAFERASVYFTSPEDTILYKLEWYLAGDQVSQKQWSDVMGMIKVQGASLDLAYLVQWASVLGLSALLDRALVESEE